MERWLPVIIGILLTGLGVSQIKGDVSALHSYHRVHVCAENRKKLGLWTGSGTVLIGLNVAILGLLFGNSNQSGSGILWMCLPGMLGAAISLYGIIKYNGSLFGLRKPK